MTGENKQNRINPQPNRNEKEEVIKLKVVQTAGYDCSGYGAVVIISNPFIKNYRNIVQKHRTDMHGAFLCTRSGAGNFKKLLTNLFFMGNSLKNNDYKIRNK